MKKLTITTSLFLFLFSISSLSAQEWELLYETNGFEKLKTISFPDSVHGWMVGDRPGDNLSYILHTSDGGESWTEQSTPLSTKLLDVHFRDSQTGFVLGPNSLQKSEDGGNTWREIDLGDDPDIRLLKGMDFVDSTAWIFGSSGAFLKSIDSGESWTKVESLSAEVEHNAMDFVNADTGVIVGQKGYREWVVLNTTDGGDTWNEKIVAQENVTMLDVFFADDSTVFMAGRSGYVFRSQDAGFTWEEVARLESASGTYLINWSLYFEDSKRGWMASALPGKEFIYIHRTVDGGENWTREIGGSLDATNLELNHILFDESGTGWSCGSRNPRGASQGAYMLKRVPVVLPEAFCKDTLMFLDENGELHLKPEDIDNGSSDNSGIIDSMWVERSLFYCAFLTETYEVSLFVADPAGNISTCKSMVTVLDSIAPVAVCSDITLMLDSAGNATLDPMDLDGGSYDNCEFGFRVDKENFNTEDLGSNKVWLTVIDQYYNRDSCQATVTVEAYDPVSLDPRKMNGSQFASLHTFPNPFMDETSLGIEIIKESQVKLEVYSTTGQLVERVFEGKLSPGKYSYSFSPKEGGSGSYFCVLKTGLETHTQIIFQTK